jgi:hypothetical protein
LPGVAGARLTLFGFSGRFWAAVFAGATVALFFVSRGKWSDPLIDSGREWVVPDALANGGLLYRDVVYWFGPFTPYWHAGFFRLFGSGFESLVLAGIVAAVGILGALFMALRVVARSAQALLWTALAIPALLFMPNAGGVVLGMGYRMWHAAAFALAAVALSAGQSERRESGRLLLAGCLAGLAGLCRTEWGLATLAGVWLAGAWRERGRRGLGWQSARALLGFVLVFAGGMGFFWLRAGGRALTWDAPVLLLNLPAETRSQVALAAFRPWKAGIWPLLYGAAVWIALFLLVDLAALRRFDLARLRRLLLLVGVFAVSGWFGGSSGSVFFNGAPLICGASCLAAIGLGRGPRAAALLGCGLLGVVLSHRRLFFLDDGPYVGPPLLFAVVCLAGLLSLALERHRDPRSRERLEATALAALAVLVGLAFAGRTAEYLADRRVPIAGTGGMLAARPELARQIEGLAGTIRRETAPGDGLVVFPEGELLNFLSGRRNPIRYKLYLPGYLTRQNEPEVLEELERERPAAIVVWNRPTGEYGRGNFGQDFGALILRWVERNYSLQAFRAAGDHGRIPSFLYGLRREGTADTAADRATGMEPAEPPRNRAARSIPVR